jgi:hypothetical protein
VTISYILKNSKESSNILLELIDEFSKVARYWISIQDQCAKVHCRHIISALEKLRLGDHEFEASLGYIVRRCLKKKINYKLIN